MPVPSEFDYEEIAHVERRFDLENRYGRDPLAALLARLRDVRRDPNDRLARVTPEELASCLRALGDTPWPVEVHGFVCDLLEGKLPAPQGKPSYYSEADFERGYALYQQARTRFAEIKRNGSLDAWLEENELPSHSSPSEAAAAWVARNRFPGLSASALRNRFSSIAQRHSVTEKRRRSTD